MKRPAWLSASILAAAGLIWAAVAVVSPRREPAQLFPDGALLYLEARDFHGLLHDWESSKEKRAWLTSDNYAAFSRSRLFERLSQAQNEFSTAASIPADSRLLASVAGAESALALYDIGNLEFVYITHMSQAQAEATPLWQVRDKFELRAEGAAQFYVRTDQQSTRTAAFALRDGWLILGTRADLVAGVLDRLVNANMRSLSEDAWYVDALKQASGPAQDLRMVLNLEKIVPSPYFRSYWIQRNITEMSQYRAALCDLHRASDAYVEQRALLRKPGVGAAASGNVQPLLSLVPATVDFASAQASPSIERVAAELRENFLDLRSTASSASVSAPAAIVTTDAGTRDALEERIDVAPVLAPSADPYQYLTTVLTAARPGAMLLLYQTHTSPGEMFVRVDQAAVLEGSWQQRDAEQAIAAALRRGLTASQLGLSWDVRPSSSGPYSVLSGPVPLALAVRDNRLFLSTSESLIQSLLAANHTPSSASSSGPTYAAIFHHTSLQQSAFHTLFQRLDTATHGGVTQDTIDSDGASVHTDGQAPSFFSGNMASLSRMFNSASSESIEERDEGAQVRQIVRYEWQRP